MGPKTLHSILSHVQACRDTRYLRCDTQYSAPVTLPLPRTSFPRRSFSVSYMADTEKLGNRSMVPHPHDEADTATTCGDGRTSSSKAPSLAGDPLRRCPDGGWDAWLTVLGAFLALFCTFGQLNAFGTFQTWYAGHQLRDLPPSTIAWIGSLQLWIFFFSVRIT